MRVGLIGVGRIGTMHAHNLAETEGVDEVLLFDTYADGPAKVAADLGGRARLTDSTDDLLVAGRRAVRIGLDGTLD